MFNPFAYEAADVIRTHHRKIAPMLYQHDFYVVFNGKIYRFTQISTLMFGRRLTLWSMASTH